MADQKQVALQADDDVNILPPDYSLKRAIGNLELGNILDESVVGEAQEKVNAQQENFLQWVVEDLVKLEQACLALKTPADKKAQLKELHAAAQTIKSHAGTFGFTLASQLARSLYTFCDMYNFSDVHYKVISKHLDALKLVIEKRIKGDGGAVGQELLTDLSKLKEKLKNN